MVKRLKLLKIITIVLFLILVFRAGQLQIIEGEYYYQLSEGNRVSLRPINAPRGKIMTGDGRILVTNKLSYNLYLLPNEIPPGLEVDSLLTELIRMTELDYQRLRENYDYFNSENQVQEAILLRRNISPETMVIVEENQDELPGLVVKESSIRDYVYGDFATHVLGYVGEISEVELKKYNAMGFDYDGNDIVGKTGLEKEYELYLQGTEGIEQVEVNNRGLKVRTLGTKPPVAGDDLLLNLDFTLQKRTEDLLEETFEKLQLLADEDSEIEAPTGAAALVMEVDTGKILALSSFPAFDLNIFARGISNKEYQQLNNNPLNPLLNRTIMASVPPGSIFKLVTGTAAIEELNIDGDTVFYDKNGKFYLPNWSRPYRNWHEGGEGELSFIRAIGRSNNIVFYELGYELYKKSKGENLAKYARDYGLGSKTGIDLPGEKKGLVPDREWKERTFGEGWYPGDSVNLAIGQGGLLTTPIQLIEMISGIANEGKVFRPYIVDKIIDQEGRVLLDQKPEVKRELPFSQDVYDTLKQGLIEVTTSDYGTGRSVFRDYPIEVAGKTGTAQTGRAAVSHGWFVGYAPADNPRVAVLVYLENGGSSSHTLPVAAGIFGEYFGIEDQEKAEKSGDLNQDQESLKPVRNRLLEFLREVFSGE